MSNLPKVIYKVNVSSIPTGFFNITLQAYLKIQIKSIGSRTVKRLLNKINSGEEMSKYKMTLERRQKASYYRENERLTRQNES